MRCGSAPHIHSMPGAAHHDKKTSWSQQLHRAAVVEGVVGLVCVQEQCQQDSCACNCGCTTPAAVTCVHEDEVNAASSAFLEQLLDAVSSKAQHELDLVLNASLAPVASRCVCIVLVDLQAAAASGQAFRLL